MEYQTYLHLGDNEWVFTPILIPIPVESWPVSPSKLFLQSVCTTHGACAMHPPHEMNEKRGKGELDESKVERGIAERSNRYTMP
jgi:hypothetical protein